MMLLNMVPSMVVSCTFSHNFHLALLAPLRGQSGKTFDVLDEQLKPLADVLSEETKWWLQKVVFLIGA